MNYYEEAKEIFEDFDFTINMGAFDIQKDKFILHKDFLKDNVNRKLVFNSNTAFPLASGTRVQKYIMKGYEIDSLELTKILLTINNLKIKNYEDLEKHLGGMYGENILEFTKEEKENEFNMLNILNKLEHYYDEEHEFKRENKEMGDLLDIEDAIVRFQKLLDLQIPCFEYNGNYYISIKKDDYVQIDEEMVGKYPELYMRNTKMIAYKFVHKVGDKYYSFYDERYEYKIGQEQLPNNRFLYVCRYKDLKNTTYKNEKDKALLKCEIDLKDIENLNNAQLEVKKLKVLEIKDINNESNVDELPF